MVKKDMLATSELNDYLEEYLEEKQEVKNLTEETIKKQTFNISKFINFLEDKGVEELTDSNVKKQLRQYRRYCLKQRENKRTTVKTYMMNILEFINSEDVQEEIQHETIKMKDIIEVKAEDPETAKKRIEKISLTRPQSNYLLQTIELEGNIRDNIDPSKLYTDKEINKLLNEVGLGDFMIGKNLEYKIEENGSNISVGEKQLICIARALLKRTKIILMDEATANIDYKTEEILKKNINEDTKDSTVITIAHRIKTVIGYDKILVLKDGEIEEFDSPDNLIKKKGLFYQLYKESFA